MSAELPLSFRLQVLLMILLGWLAMFFLVNRRQVQLTRRRSFRTALDRRLPFLPQFALVYFSTYVFVILPFVILREAGLFRWMATSFVAISVLSTLIHFAVPSRIERVEQFEGQGASGWRLGCSSGSVSRMAISGLLYWIFF